MHGNKVSILLNLVIKRSHDTQIYCGINRIFSILHPRAAHSGCPKSITVSLFVAKSNL